MPVVFQDKSGYLHIWKKNCSVSSVHKEGVNDNETKCNGKIADILLSQNIDVWKQNNLTRDEIEDLNNGFAVNKPLLKL